MLIEILLGPEDGKIKEINADRIVFGREAGCDVFFPYAGKVSNPHAVIVRQDDGYHLIDVGKAGEGSTNGTLILRNNGDHVKIWRMKQNPPLPGERVPIEKGDIVILGDSIWFRVLGG